MDMIVLRFSCLTVCIGIFMVCRGEILYFIKSISLPGVGRKTSASKLNKHLSRIFQVVTNGKHLKEKVITFVFISLFILIAMNIVMFKTFGYKGILIAVIMALMPYGYIRTRLFVKQISGSFEGEMLINELINQYKISDKNIYETIDKCVLELDDSTLSKKVLFQLKLRINSYVGEEELREALNDFTAGWDTIWARMLADNIYNAVREEVDILQGLENIRDQGKEITNFIEADKKDGMETEVMVKILCPLFSVLMVYMAKNMVGYSWSTILRYEFAEPAGLFIFTMLVFLVAVNLIVFPVIGKQKYDF